LLDARAWLIVRAVIASTPPAAQPGSRTRQLGLWMATSLVVGNMIGSGIFLLPAALAPYRGYGVLSWLITATGSVALALTFARLARRFPRAGGPYVYAREGFGEFTGFFMAWGYWISILATNAAIATALASYLTVFWPALGRAPALSISVTLGTIWALTLFNASGVRNGGLIQVITVVMKIVPLALIGTIGLLYIRPEAFVFEPPAGDTPLGSLNAAVALTLFAFLGFECATIPADNVVEPERTIPRATLLGTVFTAVVYVSSTVAVMGIVPAGTLAGSTAPFADAARTIWGSWAAYLMGAGAIVSCFGALNGWILVQGQVPMAMARDGLFPAFLARTRADGAPAAALVASSVLVTILVLFGFTGTLVELFTKTVLLATLTAVVPLLFAAMTELGCALAQPAGVDGTARRGTGALLVPSVGFIYGMWAVIGAGQETVYLGFVLLLGGLPIYVGMKK
jgi:APA family basic amino acid/polyamine antiporter